MSQETPEDRTILAALDAPDGEIGTSASGAPKSARDETAETLARLYTEVLGLLPYELEPQAPRPEARERLLAALAAAPPVSTVNAAREEVLETEPVRPASAPESVPLPPAEPGLPPPVAPVSVPESRPSEEVRIPRAAPMAPTASFPEPPPPRRWPVALAASLALILAGLSIVLGYLVGEQRARIDNLEAELSKARAGEERARRAEARAERAHTEMLKMRESLSLVTTPSVIAMPLRPLGDAPQPEAKGLLFVAADHQHWHLSLHQLRAPEPGRQYQLWFVTEEGRVLSGGTFTARGQAVSMSSPTMPEGTVAATVTLEPVGGSISPTGPEILKTEEPIELL